jgi:hypothetical protein
MMLIIRATGSREATPTAATSTKASSKDEKHIEREFSQAGGTLAAAGCISALSSYRLRHYAIQSCRASDIRVIKQAAGFQDS